jgi:peroxiredoxin
MTIKKGDTAPDAKVFNAADNAPFQLASLKGKPTVVLFFPAVFSGVCDTEMCNFRDSLSAYNSLGAQVVAISTDAPPAQREFVKKHGLTFPILSDVHHNAIKAYGVEFTGFAKIEGFTVANRAVFVQDKSGKVAWSWVAPSPGNEPPYDEVKKAVSALK